MSGRILQFARSDKSPHVSAADVDPTFCPAMLRYALVIRELEQVRSRDRLAAAVEQLVQLAERERLRLRSAGA